MCGIVGGAGRPIPAELLELAIRALDHRGPDGRGQRCHRAGESTLSMGHTRLAINDLSDSGAQPVVLADARLSMVFNGEIYNYPELRRECEQRGRRFRSSMDGEVILHLWALDGPGSLERLNGIFAVAVADDEAGRLWLARDPMGVKPLFYTTLADGSLRFASELTALRRLDVEDGGHDVTAMAQFLSFLWARIRPPPSGGCTPWCPAGWWRGTGAGSRSPDTTAASAGSPPSCRRRRGRRGPGQARRGGPAAASPTCQLASWRRVGWTAG